MSWWEVLRQVWWYSRERHSWWFLVVVTLLVGIGWLVALSEASLVAPFLYPLF